MVHKPEIEWKTPTEYIGIRPGSVGFEEDFESFPDQKRLNWFITSNEMHRNML